MNHNAISVATIMACALGCEIPWSRRRPIIIDGQEREDYELGDEYEKIQRKESRLSKADRDRVVYVYERRQEVLRIAAQAGKPAP